MGRCIGVGTAGRYYGKGHLASRGLWEGKSIPLEEKFLISEDGTNIVSDDGHCLIVMGPIQHPVMHNGNAITRSGNVVVR